ncbi:hypothetical protein [Hymenobacter crusticola]|uniref:hypothetical protein n=1 Tax=Hymenobacter crusticola TaxID=1770526 RepID=UPI0011799BEE|nr:hypothetical protein [Hymenobacter crusticola]
MKRLFAFCLLYSGASLSWGQGQTAFPVDPTTHRIRYSGLVSVTGRRQADLQAGAQAWAKGISPPDKPAVLTHAPDAERLIVHGSQPFPIRIAMLRRRRPRVRYHTIQSSWCCTIPRRFRCRTGATRMT